MYFTRTIVRSGILTCLAAVSACGSNSTPNDASVTDSASDAAALDGTAPDDTTALDAAAPDDGSVLADAATDGFVVADHEPLPQIPNQGGATIAHPYIVTITYADDSHRAREEAFGQWVGGSTWLTTVGADYGVGSGTWLGNVEIPDAAPDATSDVELQTQLLAWAAAGQLPTAPDGTRNNVVYLVYFPMHTSATWVAGGSSCRDFLGFHGYAHNAQDTVVYGAMFDCGPFPDSGVDELGIVTGSASHELIEAATDPNSMYDPAYSFSALDNSAWLAESGENGDLCSFPHVYYQEGGFNLTRVWSNTAAANGTDPCVPTDGADPYYNTSLTPSTIVMAHAGGTVTYDLAGFSLAPVADWQLEFRSSGSFVPTAQFSSTTMNNGGTGTLTLQIPATAAQNAYIRGAVRSKHSSTEFHSWPVLVVVN